MNGGLKGRDIPATVGHGLPALRRTMEAGSVMCHAPCQGWDLWSCMIPRAAALGWVCHGPPGPLRHSAVSGRGSWRRRGVVAARGARSSSLTARWGHFRESCSATGGYSQIDPSKREGAIASRLQHDDIGRNWGPESLTYHNPPAGILPIRIGRCHSARHDRRRPTRRGVGCSDRAPGCFVVPCARRAVYDG